MKSVFPIASLIATTFFGSMALAEATTTAPVQGEVVYGYITTQQGITFQVASNGCTTKDSFLISRQQSRPDPTMRVNLVRVKPDFCKGLFFHGTLVTYTFEELELDGKSFIIQNEVSHPLAKTGNN